VKHVAHSTGYPDTAANRRALAPLAALVGAAVAAGKTLDEIRAILRGSSAPRTDRTPSSAMPASETRPATGPTVEEYYEDWIKQQLPVVRRGQGRDYRRHFRRYILPVMRNVPLADLWPVHVRGLQVELLGQDVKGPNGTTKKRSVKHVKNIVCGSFRAMIQQARIDGFVTRDIFAGLKWPKWTPPKPDPFTLEEQQRILAWFKTHRFGFHPGPRSTSLRYRPHPPYHAFLHLLFTSGLRPSEAAGLQWGDIDLAGRRLHVRRSRYLYAYADPKTESARRTVELFDATVAVLRAIQPLHVTPEMPVFVNTNGQPIEPNSLLPHWYRCLRACGIRVRGLYSTKDTFVTTALRVDVRKAWLEAQTGVNYATLRRHYGEWMPSDDRRDLDRFTDYAPEVFAAKPPKLSPRKRGGGGQFRNSPMKSTVEKCERGDLNPHGFYPTGS
jgi:integrase